MSQSKVKLFLCLTNYALCHHGICGSRCIDPCFLDLGTSWRWVISFTPWPFYPQRKSPRYPLDRMLGRPQNQSGRHEEELWPLGRPACSQLLYWLRYPSSPIMFQKLTIWGKSWGGGFFFFNFTDYNLVSSKTSVEKHCSRVHITRFNIPMKVHDTLKHENKYWQICK
jgi:hypothetical protein